MKTAYRFRSILRCLQIVLIFGFVCIYTSQIQAREKISDGAFEPAINNSQAQTEEPLRLKLFLDETRTIRFEVAPETVAVLASDIVTAEIVRPDSVRVSCLTLGETVLIVSGGGKRFVVVVEVVSHPSQSASEFGFQAEQSRAKISGVYTVGGSSPTRFSSTYLRHSLTFQRRLSDAKTLRGEVELYHPVGRRNEQFVSGLSRLSLNLIERDKVIEFFDGSVDFSRADLNNYQIRGFHYKKTATGKLQKPRAAQEFFAGFARQSSNFFDRRGNGAIVGGALPILQTPRFILRGGAIAVFPTRRDGGKNAPEMVIRADAQFEQSERNQYKFAVDVDSRGVSFHAQTDNRIGDFIVYTELARISRTSPFIKIGAQFAARDEINGSVFWQPKKKPFSAFAVSNRTKTAVTNVNQVFNSFDFDSLSAGFNYTPNVRTRFNASYSLQNVTIGNSAARTASNGIFIGADGFIVANIGRTESRTVGFGYSQSIGRNLSNDFALRQTISRNPQLKADLEHGFTVRDEVRRAFERFSVSGFVEASRRAPTAESVIVRNPNQLPANLRQEYVRNPAALLAAFRRAPFDLSGIAAPLLTRSLEAGIKTEGSFRRHSFTAETRFVNGDYAGQRQNNVLLTGGYVFRADDANLIGVSVSRVITTTANATGATAVSVNYTHRFGEQNKKNFSLLDALNLRKLFAPRKTKLTGRVFNDLNNNGRDDGEPGLANVQVVLDNGRTATSDRDGNYVFDQVSTQTHRVAVKIPDLGVAMRASTPNEQTVRLNKNNSSVNFGLVNSGLLTGRVFVDDNGANAAGLFDVRLNLTAPDGKTVTVTTDSAGRFEIVALKPGDYVLEIVAASLPPNYRIPSETKMSVRVVPLRPTYINFPIAANRAIAGIILRGTGEPVAKARVKATIKNSAGQPTVIEAVTNQNGAYILRNLPAGTVEIEATAPDNSKTTIRVIELSLEPTTQRGINLALPKR